MDRLSAFALITVFQLVRVVSVLKLREVPSCAFCALFIEAMRLGKQSSDGIRIA